MIHRSKMYLLTTYILLAIMTIVLLLFTYWQFAPYKTVTINSVKLEETTVTQGENLAVDLNYDRYTNLTSRVHREFLNGIIFTTPTSDGPGKPGHYDRRLEVEIPLTIPPGEYILKTYAVFQVNPIRQITVTWETEKFTVLSSHPDLQLDKEEGL